MNLLHHPPAAAAIVASMDEAIAAPRPPNGLQELFAAERFLTNAPGMLVPAARTKPKRRITDKEERRAKDQRQRQARIAARRLRKARK